MAVAVLAAAAIAWRRRRRTLPGGSSQGNDAQSSAREADDASSDQGQGSEDLVILAGPNKFASNRSAELAHPQLDPRPPGHQLLQANAASSAPLRSSSSGGGGSSAEQHQDPETGHDPSKWAAPHVPYAGNGGTNTSSSWPARVQGWPWKWSLSSSGARRGGSISRVASERGTWLDGMQYMQASVPWGGEMHEQGQLPLAGSSKRVPSTRPEGGHSLQALSPQQQQWQAARLLRPSSPRQPLQPALLPVDAPRVPRSEASPQSVEQSPKQRKLQPSLAWQDPAAASLGSLPKGDYLFFFVCVCFLMLCGAGGE